jgi:hypothetical protein
LGVGVDGLLTKITTVYERCKCSGGDVGEGAVLRAEVASKSWDGWEEVWAAFAGLEAAGEWCVPWVVAVVEWENGVDWGGCGCGAVGWWWLCVVGVWC